MRPNFPGVRPRRKRGALVGAALLLLGASVSAAESDRYLAAARTFADTLLRVGLDRHGEQPTAMWAGVIDAQTLTVPRDAAQVPALPGIRAQDRAVGGANYYHDLGALAAFRALTAATGEPVYARAAEAYTRDFLRRCQSPDTGLLAWGEHLYYDVFRDRVAAERIHHEFLGATPPWSELWKTDAGATERAIAGVRYHFRSFAPENYLFNRHTPWLAPAFQSAGQPWIKHTGLQAYSFAFLYAQTRDEQWLTWLRGTGALYWDHRDRRTDLTLGCIGDPRAEAQQSTFGGTALVAYWLLRAWQLVPAETALRERAQALFLAAERHSRTADGYLERTTVEGRPAGGLMTPWTVRYGESSLVPVGRIAAWFAATLGDARFRAPALRLGALVHQAAPPEDAVVESVAQALHFALDLHALTGDADQLEAARRYADWALARYVRNGLFVRQAGDRFYEAKVGPGDLAAALVRLHVRLHPALSARVPDASFAL